MANSDERTAIPDFWYTGEHIEALGRQWEREAPAAERRIFKYPTGEGIDKTGLTEGIIERINEYPTEIMLPYNMSGNHWIMVGIIVNLEASGRKTAKIQFSDSLKGKHTPESLARATPGLEAEKVRLRGIFEGRGFAAGDITITDYPHTWIQEDDKSCGPYSLENGARMLAGAGAEPNPRREAIRKKQLDKIENFGTIKSMSRDNLLEEVLNHWVFTKLGGEAADIVPNSVEQIVDEYRRINPRAEKDALITRFRREYGLEKPVFYCCNRMKEIAKDYGFDQKYITALGFPEEKEKIDRLCRYLLDQRQLLMRLRQEEPYTEAQVNKLMSDLITKIRERDERSDIRVKDQVEAMFKAVLPHDEPNNIAKFAMQSYNKIASSIINNKRTMGRLFDSLAADYARKAGEVAAAPAVHHAAAEALAPGGVESRSPSPAVGTVSSPRSPSSMSSDSALSERVPSPVAFMSDAPAVPTRSTKDDEFFAAYGDQSGFTEMLLKGLVNDTDELFRGDLGLTQEQAFAFAKEGVLKKIPKSLQFTILRDQINALEFQDTRTGKDGEVSPKLVAVVVEYDGAKAEHERIKRARESAGTSIAAPVAVSTAVPAPAPSADPAPPPSYEATMQNSFFEKYPTGADLKAMLKKKLDTELDKAPGREAEIFDSAKTALKDRGGELEFAPDAIKDAVAGIGNASSLDEALEGIEEEYNLALVMHQTARVAPSATVATVSTPAAKGKGAAKAKQPEVNSWEDALIFIGRNVKEARDQRAPAAEVEGVFESSKAFLRASTTNSDVLDALDAVPDLTTFEAISNLQDEVKQGIAAPKARTGAAPKGKRSFFKRVFRR